MTYWKFIEDNGKEIPKTFSPSCGLTKSSLEFSHTHKQLQFHLCPPICRQPRERLDWYMNGVSGEQPSFAGLKSSCTLNIQQLPSTYFTKRAHCLNSLKSLSQEKYVMRASLVCVMDYMCWTELKCIWIHQFVHPWSSNIGLRPSSYPSVKPKLQGCCKDKTDSFPVLLLWEPWKRLPVQQWQDTWKSASSDQWSLTMSLTNPAMKTTGHHTLTSTVYYTGITAMQLFQGHSSQLARVHISRRKIQSSLLQEPKVLERSHQVVPYFQEQICQV